MRHAEATGIRHPKCVARDDPDRSLGRASLEHAEENHMIDDRNTRPSSDDAERDRVARDMAGRLFTRGIDVRDDDSNDDVTAIEEAVERFESRVQAAGGDLMVDEPPRGQRGKPDEARFRLPLRHADESASAYVRRLSHAADELRLHPPR
jgi:hypothetical protein